METVTAEELERDLNELERLCAPLIEYLQKNRDPHTWIVIQWDRASLMKEEIGQPFEVPD